MKDHYRYNVIINDGNVKRQLKIQHMEVNDQLFGVCEDITLGYIDVRSGAALPTTYYILAFYTPESEYYLNELVLERANAAVDFMLRSQHEDGTVDFPPTNFHDAAECAYIVQILYPALKVMSAKTNHSEAEDIIYSSLTLFLSRLADGILAGGFHTPNHRWVISSACAILYNLLNRQDCLNYMKLFLAEGIDYNENGEYSERSSNIYNVICNRSLIYLAREYDMPELYDPVERNLSMLMMYIEPNDTVNMFNTVPGSPNIEHDNINASLQYSAYLIMALQTQNPEFIYCADHLLDIILSRQNTDGEPAIGAVDFFHVLLLEPELFELTQKTDAKKPPLSYCRQYMNGNVIRYRSGNFTVTVMNRKAAFLKLQYNAHTLFVRAAGSFFSLGQFIPQQLEKTENGCILSFHAQASYMKPLQYPQSTSAWNKMDHSLREQVMPQAFDISCKISFEEQGVSLNIDIGGCDRVPLKLEFVLEPGGKYCTDDAELWLCEKNYVYQKAAASKYRYSDGSELIIGGGFDFGMGSHTYGEAMRGSVQKDENSAVIAMTAYSPNHADISLRFI